MPLDALFLSAVTAELNGRLMGAKIDKIQQPERLEVVLHTRGFGENPRLLISASPNSPRLGITKAGRENPQSPPMFCMLLRKHLTGARITEIRQEPCERVVRLMLENYTELRDVVEKQLVLEIMGRRSNLILLTGDGHVIDALHRTELSENAGRQILPGIRYELPDAQGKLRPDVDLSPLRQTVLAGGDEEAAKLISGSVMGISPLIARELVCLAAGSPDLRLSAMTEYQREKLLFHLERLLNAVEAGEVLPVLLTHRDGSPADFTFTHISQYGAQRAERILGSFSELLEEFYESRDRVERDRRRAQDILKVLTSASDRLNRKIALQQKELTDCDRGEQLRICGDIVSANLHRIVQGMTEIEAENFYETEMPMVRIPLSPLLSPSRNAQKYYKDYRRAQTARRMLTEQIEKARGELMYLDTVFESLTTAENDREMDEIRRELSAQGYLRLKGEERRTKLRPTVPMRFVSSDGFEILAGKNNRQNEELSLKTAARDDVWLHVQQGAGAHVILRTGGGKPPDRTVEEAAIIAASLSKSRQSSKVAVCRARAGSLKKPPGSHPGMVTYSGYDTLFVNPDEALLKRLRRE